MSASLYWEPAKRKRHNFASGSMMADIFTGHSMWEAADIPFLRGMEAAGNTDVAALIEAIEKYEVIEVTVEY